MNKQQLNLSLSSPSSLSLSLSALSLSLSLIQRIDRKGEAQRGAGIVGVCGGLPRAVQRRARPLARRLRLHRQSSRRVSAWIGRARVAKAPPPPAPASRRRGEAWHRWREQVWRGMEEAKLVLLQ